jgi:CheY-like chemotaxis protein
MSETGQKRILLAEDDFALRETTTDLLEIFGYAVTAVIDGQAAIENFNQNRPDLVLADITMPGIDGFALLRHIRAHPSGADLPFVLMSGKTSQADVQRGLSAGVDDYVVKPFNADQLERTIARLMGGHRRVATA